MVREEDFRNRVEPISQQRELSRSLSRVKRVNGVEGLEVEGLEVLECFL